MKLLWASRQITVSGIIMERKRRSIREEEEEVEEEEASSEEEVIGGVDEEDLPTPSLTAEPEVKKRAQSEEKSPK